MRRGVDRFHPGVFVCLASVFCAGSWASPPGGELWREVQQVAGAAHAAPRITPDRYRLFELDEVGLRALLGTVLPEGSSFPPTLLSVPSPAGSFRTFAIEESPVMSPALARRFPEIRTFRGRSVEEPSVSARFGVTVHGFHGIVLDGKETFYLEPMYAGDRTHIAVYRTADYPRQQDWSCHAESSAPTPPIHSQGSGPIVQDVLYTYRLALAATGAFTEFHGGTLQAGMSAVATIVNRINGVYERDVAGRMVLVDDNDQLIYTDPITDPYTDTNIFALFFQNQSNVDKVIGDANYDLGHVVSTNNSGGGAEIASICVSGLKATSASGQKAPVGDPYYIGYVAHEIGHQWGANHTYNGCSQPNPSTAVEPGSGSTIMSYAGICNMQNLQESADDYFHIVSIAEIVDYVTSAQGNACVQETSTGNAAANAFAGPDRTIPINTPFTLCGSASAVDFDPLIANWEEIDRGPAGPANEPQGNATLFRSFPPSSSFCRTFPQISDIVNNTQTLGELLPSYARSLNFAFTLRDDHPGAGAVSTDVVHLSVTDASGPFRVLSPGGDAVWPTGTVRTVTWDPAGTNLSPVNCATVEIEASLDGGLTFEDTLAGDVPNDGEQDVGTPGNASDTVRIRVKCSDNVFFDVSDADFTVFQGGSGGCFETVYGLFSDLRADRDFSSAECMGQVPTGSVAGIAQMLPDPATGDGYWVLTRDSCGGGSFGFTPQRQAMDIASPCAP